jgi:hypothetical protein
VRRAHAFAIESFQNAIEQLRRTEKEISTRVVRRDEIYIPFFQFIHENKFGQIFYKTILIWRLLQCQQMAKRRSTVSTMINKPSLKIETRRISMVPSFSKYILIAAVFHKFRQCIPNGNICYTYFTKSYCGMTSNITVNGMCM